MTAFAARETDWPFQFAAILDADNGDTTLVAADATHVIRVVAVYLVADIAGTLRFEGNTDGSDYLSGIINLPATGGFVLPYNPVGWFETSTVNTVLNLEVVTITSINGGLVYQLVEPDIT